MKKRKPAQKESAKKNKRKKTMTKVLLIVGKVPLSYPKKENLKKRKPAQIESAKKTKTRGKRQ